MIRRFSVQIFAAMIAIGSIVGFLQTAAKAAPVPVRSHSFEEPFKDDTGSFAVYYAKAPEGWSKVSGAGTFGVVNPADRNMYTNSDDSGANGGTLPNMDGVQVGFITGKQADPTVIEQNLFMYQVEDNTTYTATIAVGERSPGGWNNGSHAYELSLVTDSGVVSSVTGKSEDFDRGTFNDVSTSFDNVGSTHSGSPLTIRYTILGDANGGNADFDNVRVDASVIPEPATLALFGLGGLLVLLRRRR